MRSSVIFLFSFTGLHSDKADAFTRRVDGIELNFREASNHYRLHSDASLNALQLVSDEIEAFIKNWCLTGVNSLPLFSWSSSGHHLRNGPRMIRDPRFHRRSDAQAAVNLAEVVVGKVQCDCGFVVLQLFAEGIR